MSSEPYISMLRTGWHYARRERKKFVLVYLMFVIDNLIIAMNPILIGWFIDKIQRDMMRVLHYALVFTGYYIGLKLPVSYTHL